MNLDQALVFALSRRNAILTTLRRDGRPQQSMIFYVASGPALLISVTTDRAKTANLRRDNRAALFISGESPFSWVSLDGTVRVGAVTRTAGDQPSDDLVDYYRRSAGEHGDWDGYRRAMVAEQRLLLIFTPAAATGILGDPAS